VYSTWFSVGVLGLLWFQAGGNLGLISRTLAAPDGQTQIDPFRDAPQTGSQPMDLRKTESGRSDGKGSPAGEKDAESTDDLFALAQRACAEGKEAKAVGCLMAEAVFHQNQELLRLLRWSPLFKRPMFSVRWGLATTVFLTNRDSDEIFFVRAPQGGIFEFRSDNAAQEAAPVVGSGVAQPSQRNKRKPGQANQAPGNIPQAGGRNATDFWRQTVGDKLLAGLQSRVNDGDFGLWIEKLGALPAMGNIPNVAPARNAPVVSGTPQRRRAPDDESDDSELGRSRSVGTAILAKRPGLTVLQASNPAEPQAGSAQEKLDFLLIADIAEKPFHFAPRNIHTTQTVIQIHIYDVAADTEVWKSREVGSGKLVLAANGVKGVGATGDLAAEVLRAIDKQFALQKMPEITEDILQERLAALAEQKTQNPLPALMELRYYEMMKLITPDQFLQQAMKIVELEDARCLTSNDAAQQKKVMDRWLSDGR
jgi:hypothetical protein